MKESIIAIFSQIQDYRKHDGVKITEQDIEIWALQFGDDAEFVLSEFAHLLPQVYVSLPKAKEFIRSHLNSLCLKWGYGKDAETFLQDTSFLSTQAKGKSQTAILELLDEVLNDKGYKKIEEYSNFPKKNFVYLDDLFASGGTFRIFILSWLPKQQQAITNKEIKFAACFFALHTWNEELLRNEIIRKFGTKINDFCLILQNIKIENHLGRNGEKLNLAIPDKSLRPLQHYEFPATATRHGNFAFRPSSMPSTETFFTNAENRIRYEKILLEKGIEIINKVEAPRDNLRPLGLIYPDYKTFGLGTHFFTWRNIPNNSPLVFWWGGEGHLWKPLFPLFNRGR